MLYEFKKNLTINLKFGDTALKICSDDINRISECKNVDPSNGHLTSCLLNNMDNITSGPCRTFLSNIAAFVFSDFRLVSDFVRDCEKDIQKYECGRLEKVEDTNLPTQQGKTIECLSEHVRELENVCKKQILRIAELQSDDFTYDRSLYFACREDRERFCERVQSGKGRVIKCLMLNKFNPLMSKPCQDQLTRVQKLYAEDAKADKTLMIACKKDILDHKCRQELRNDNSETVQLASLILCLENAIQKGDRVEPECTAELVDRRKMFMTDYKLSPNLVKECIQEINQYCDGGIERDGKTVHCLFKNYKLFARKMNKNIQFKSSCVNEVKYFSIFLSNFAAKYYPRVKKCSFYFLNEIKLLKFLIKNNLADI
jgi:Golgi apparatus protein 1